MPRITKKVKKGRGASPTRSEAHRLRSVKLVLKGNSSSAVARQFGDSPSIVARWVRSYKQVGSEALVNRKHSGRPSQLNKLQLRKLARYLITAQRVKNPVSGSRAAEFISVNFGISLTRQHARRIVSSIVDHGK